MVFVDASFRNPPCLLLLRNASTVDPPSAHIFRLSEQLRIWLASRGKQDAIGYSGRGNGRLSASSLAASIRTSIG
eukprot:scaffold98483_cov47-Attheya_sp.AAC.1